MNPHDRHLSVRAYLLERLSPAERADFEAALQSDPELAREAALQFAEMEAGEMLLEAQARAWIQEQRQARRRRNRFWLSQKPLGVLLAAAVVFLAVAIWWFRPPEKRGAVPPSAARQTPETRPAPATLPSGDTARVTPAGVADHSADPVPVRPDRYLALAVENLPEPALHALRSPVADSAQGYYRRAEAAYARGDFHLALFLLGRTDSTQRQLSAYLSAQALFRLRRFDAAAEQFSYLAGIQSRQFRYDSEWGLVMCHLAQKKRRPVALDALRKIANTPEHPYAAKAEALMAALPPSK